MTGSNVVGLNDGINGAVLSTLAAADTLVGIDLELNKLLADACRTLLVHDVSDILVSEVAKRGDNGVGSRLAKSAKRRALDVVAKLLHTVKVLKLTITGDDLVEDLKKTLGTYTAGRTLTAGLVYRELKEELGDINHTVVLVHDDQTAGAHHGADSEQVVIVDGGIDQVCGDT